MLHMAKENKEDTGTSFSEALILASTIPQYYKRLFIDLPVQYYSQVPIKQVGPNKRVGWIF